MRRVIIAGDKAPLNKANKLHITETEDGAFISVLTYDFRTGRYEQSGAVRIAPGNVGGRKPGLLHTIGKLITQAQDIKERVPASGIE